MKQTKLSVCSLYTVHATLLSTVLEHSWQTSSMGYHAEHETRHFSPIQFSLFRSLCTRFRLRLVCILYRLSLRFTETNRPQVCHCHLRPTERVIQPTSLRSITFYSIIQLHHGSI